MNIFFLLLPSLLARALVPRALAWFFALLFLSAYLFLARVLASLALLLLVFSFRYFVHVFLYLGIQKVSRLADFFIRIVIFALLRSRLLVRLRNCRLGLL